MDLKREAVEAYLQEMTGQEVSLLAMSALG